MSVNFVSTFLGKDHTQKSKLSTSDANSILGRYWKY